MESGLKKAKLENVPAEGFAAGFDSCALLDLRGSLGPVRAWTDPRPSSGSERHSKHEKTSTGLVGATGWLHSETPPGFIHAWL